MAVDTMNINKLVRWFYFSDKTLRAELLKDIRQDRLKESGEKSSGGDFYTPFWADTRKHILGEADLVELTAERIKKNARRKDIYTKLQQGVIEIWHRGHNLDVRLLDRSIKGKCKFDNIGLTVKANNILALLLEGEERIVYPYWFPEPKLSDEGARICLYLLSKTLKDHDINNIRVFDVIRAEYYSLGLVPLQGDEIDLIEANYKRIISMRDKILLEKMMS
ncbi:MAG: hypothetical protein CMP22_08015 [Rickettsiales bacterium]|nr:hypothetical protein [Rickettsiales bacterium]|tara:strand:+ start:781 stop:1443 length:663 start_codon:yes stop_codon:yes gene_type:complete